MTPQVVIRWFYAPEAKECTVRFDLSGKLSDQESLLRDLADKCAPGGVFVTIEEP